jgi:hypothetical protein
MRAVMDTNVLVSAFRSQSGASYELLRLLRAAKWTLVLSNTVLGEYQEVLHREAGFLRITHTDTDAYLDVLCALAEQRMLASEWQPALLTPTMSHCFNWRARQGFGILLRTTSGTCGAPRSLVCKCCARRNSLNC